MTESDYDWKLLKVQRCSYRCLSDLMYAILNTGAKIHSSHVFGRNEMLVKPDWTSAEILVQIPRMMKAKSYAHKSNIEFFEQIRGVTVCEPPPSPKVNVN
ncbi:MAG: hypothetical protein K2Y22_04315 [Candidatus Obscuribacterales bacterium]|nr:hypothetical protein [Candidatus Obscuribacterales bacterium]